MKAVRIPVMGLRPILGSMYYWSPATHLHSVGSFIGEMVNYLPFSSDSGHLILLAYDPVDEELHVR